jgi:hypothetical protein
MEVAVANGDETEVKAPNSWIAFASKYGFPGVIVFLMAGFIWVMFNFITGSLISRLAAIETGMSTLIQLQKDDMAQRKEYNKDELQRLDNISKALERRPR